MWPQLGGFAVFAPFSNFGGKGTVPIGSLPGITAYGAFDMAGNVREWCWNEAPTGRVIRGGAWDDNTYMFGATGRAAPMDRSARNGFRCALYPNPEKIPSTALQIAPPPEDIRLGKPVADSVFQVYREQFSYDKTDLKARVESRQDNSAGWVHEKITFDAAYGGERVIAHLFLPKNAAPPFQAVIYFPGDASRFQRSSQNIEEFYEFPMFLSFFVKNGRAVVYPVYKGTFERGFAALGRLTGAGSAPAASGDGTPHQQAETLIQQVKDLKRCIDYLETRPDIDRRKIAYYGMSEGAILGPQMTAVEERLRASVLLGGFLTFGGRPEVKAINYVTRVKTPTLMLNGKYDLAFERLTKPMFDLLGTPAEHKLLKVYETDHIPPRNEYIKESLAWFDRYLGPVK
jgi:hypothetical protein